ncbi:hypothetical protein FRB94_002480 [Tulasnella sp. JGI-2019a]|nr:hypothetical protein FRB94_002480 [Tulasnella sp. JGI-2019a]KAG9032461.1 hypothetical protein FRB95_001436 [Tulasnella sp. JGI-2019a]
MLNSSSGRPFTTPKGHTPAWVGKVKWHAASAFDPPSYAPLLENKTAVVHTLGILLEGGKYKSAVRSGDILGLFSSFCGASGSSNPLERGANGEGEYEKMNRDSALRVFETYAASSPAPADNHKAFVYVSAEDIFRPFVPRRYIDTKREAEREIFKMCEERKAAGLPLIQGVFVRPGLMYHPHLRPFTTPVATLLDLSSNLHHNPPFRLPLPLPSNILRSMVAPRKSADSEESSSVEPSALSSMANALEVPPIHVDTVADAIVEIVQHRPDVCGPVGVEAMRDIIGWHRQSKGFRGQEHAV